MRRRWIIFALLCPVILIAIWAAAYLVFGVSSDDQGYKDFCGSVEPIRSSFQEFFKDKKDYPAYTLAQLRKMGAFDAGTQEFLDDYWIHYIPFSSKTPDDKIVLRIGCSPFGGVPWLCDFSLTKYELTHDLMAEARQRSDQLQLTTAKEVRDFKVKHPTYSIIAANPWCQGTTPQDSRAHLTIAYRKPGDSLTYEDNFNFTEENHDWVLDAHP